MPTSWFPYIPHTRSNAAVLLFCFAHAGGAASSYHTWADALGPEIAVLAVQLPGRENRLMEPALTRMSDVVDQLVPVLEDRIDRPFAIYGHSMGAAVGYEVAAVLERRDHRPQLLAVSGRRTPRLHPRRPYIHQQTDAQMIEYLEELGGTPGAILREPEMLALLLPMLRTDLAVLETHRSRAEPLGCDILALRGFDDCIASSQDVEAWCELTTAKFEFEQLTGGHFFTPQSLLTIQQRLRRRLIDEAPRRGASSP